MSPSKRQNSHQNILFSLVKHYDKNYFYWEFIIFAKRIICALLSISFNSNYSKSVLIIILFVYLFMEQKCQPFVIKQMNDFEFLLTFLLCGAIVADIAFEKEVLFTYIIASLALSP
eukprot:440357_1